MTAPAPETITVPAKLMCGHHKDNVTRHFTYVTRHFTYCLGHSVAYRLVVVAL